MGFGLDYAREVMDVFNQLTKQASQDNLHEIENFFLGVQKMIKEMMTHINELQRNEVILIVTQWASSITEMVEDADKTFACPWVG